LKKYTDMLPQWAIAQGIFNAICFPSVIEKLIMDEF